MGSVLVGSAEQIARARQARKMFGGALRQAGIVAAAALYALDHHVARLAEDHALARLLAEELATIEGLVVDPASVETNLVFFELESACGPAGALAAALRERGIRLYDIGPQRLRACTHLDLQRNDILTATRVMREVLSDLGRR
jgi:threonine aldolase